MLGRGAKSVAGSEKRAIGARVCRNEFCDRRSAARSGSVMRGNARKNGPEHGRVGGASRRHVTLLLFHNRRASTAIAFRLSQYGVIEVEQVPDRPTFFAPAEQCVLSFDHAHSGMPGTTCQGGFTTRSDLLW